jgi:transposase
VKKAGRPSGRGWALAEIAATVRAKEVIAGDETSARVNGKTHGQWTFGCTTAVFHVIAGRAASAYRQTFSPACAVRSPTGAVHTRRASSRQFKAFLKDACAVGHPRPDLADITIATHRRHLDRELDRLLDLEPIDVGGSHWQVTIAVTARDKLLVFLTSRDVEATNNESERALRSSGRGDERVSLRGDRPPA